ncbi:MAG: IS4 family transposase [Bacteroidetes bacterium]|nr:IS4 family transposase [Bacteroidota bacterium]
MFIGDILKVLPDSLLEELALETGVNKYSKKLQGEILFKLLIYSIVSNKDNSLRGMESAYETLAFNVLNQEGTKSSIRYSSISERIKTMDYRYFEKLFNKCVELYGSIIGEEHSKLLRFDSTIITASGKLLKCGYVIKGSAAAYLNQLKFTIGFSEIPISADVYSGSIPVPENTALRAAVLEHQPSNENAVRVFDKGVSGRNTFEELSKKKIPFVTLLFANSNLEIISENFIKEKIITEKLTIESDCWVHLFKRNGKTEIPFRCIHTIQNKTGEVLRFITNIPDLSAEEIYALYKQRWDIEVFFKFLKQELNLSHLLNRSENGIRSILYVTLIASILIIVYKKTNGHKGYKIMKQRFVQEMEKLVAIDLVYLCDGNPEKAKKILFNTS